MVFARFFACTFLIFLCSSADAQHEWIKENTPYLKIKTVENGIYYLTQQSLTSAGMPSGTDPRTLQLFRRGEEQNILVAGEEDGAFDAEDTLYFYGQRNDGIPDSSLYIESSYQLHPWLNIFSDTAVYFLTWGAQNGLRMTLPSLNPTEIATFHQAESSIYFHDDYARGKLISVETYSSKFDVGEGWCSIPFSDSYSFTLNNIQDVYPGIDPTIEIKVVGRNQYSHSRKVIVKLGNPISPDYQETIDGFLLNEKAGIIFSFPHQLLSSSTLQVTLEPIAEVTGFGNPINYISIYYCGLIYGQSIASPSANQKVYHVSGSSAEEHASLTWNTPSPKIFNITNPNQVTLLPFTYNGSVIDVSYGTNTDSFLVISKASLLEPAIISKKHYSLPDISSDYYIVSHSSLEESVQHYVDYRSSNAGGNYNVSTVWVEDLYDIFSYGELTPLALYRYGKYLYTLNPDARFMTIIGSGVDIVHQRESNFYRWNPDYFHNETDEQLRLVNLVPTAGSPGSDLLFVMDDDLNPHLAIGRVPAKSNTQVIDYLNKVIEHEAKTTRNKNLIHISGGRVQSEVEIWAAVMNNWKTIVENSIWKGTVTQSFQISDAPPLAVSSIADAVNAGVSFINFLGHATAQITQPNIGYVSADSNGYVNKGKYPMLISGGCEAGNIFCDYSLLEDWVMTPDRGAILSIGTSGINYSSWADNCSRNLYKSLFEQQENFGRPVGKIMNNTFNEPVDHFYGILQTQMILCGDPAVIVNPDYDVTSINHKENISFVAIRPNPNNGTFTIDSKMDGLFEIINARGLLVYKDNLLEGVNNIRLHLSPGMYLIKLVGEDHQEQLKVLVY